MLPASRWGQFANDPAQTAFCAAPAKKTQVLQQYAFFLPSANKLLPNSYQTLISNIGQKLFNSIAKYYGRMYTILRTEKKRSFEEQRL